MQADWPNASRKDLKPEDRTKSKSTRATRARMKSQHHDMELKAHKEEANVGFEQGDSGNTSTG